MKVEEKVKNRYELLTKVFEKLNNGNIIKGKDIHTFILMCVNAEENGRLVVSKNMRWEFEELLNLTTQSLSNSIARLKDEDLIEGERGVYILKPETLWGGNEESRKNFFIENDCFEIIIKMK